MIAFGACFFFCFPFSSSFAQAVDWPNIRLGWSWFLLQLKTSAKNSLFCTTIYIGTFPICPCSCLRSLLALLPSDFTLPLSPSFTGSHRLGWVYHPVFLQLMWWLILKLSCHIYQGYLRNNWNVSVWPMISDLHTLSYTHYSSIPFMLYRPRM